MEENVSYMNSVLPIKESFDLLQRDIIIGEKKSTFFKKRGKNILYRIDARHISREYEEENEG